MEPPNTNAIISITNPSNPEDSRIQGIVKKSGVDANGRTWALVWYNELVAAYVGFVEWQETGWIFSNRRFETLHPEWRHAIEKIISLHHLTRPAHP